MSLNRREFLKFSAGVSAAASSLSGGALQGAANGGEKHVHSFCEMCSSRCPIEAKVVDGKVRFLSGNPKAGGTATSLCARGGSGLSQLYDENRIKKPLIRAGERGENKWREVSWRRLTMSLQRCLISSKSMVLKALSLPVKARKRTS